MFLLPRNYLVLVYGKSLGNMSTIEEFAVYRKQKQSDLFEKGYKFDQEKQIKSLIVFLYES